MENTDKKIPEVKTIETPAGKSARARAAQRVEEAAKRTAAARQKVLIIGLLVVVAVNAMIAYFLHGVLVEDVQQQRLKELTQQQTQARAKSVGAYVEQINQRFQQAVAFPGLSAALIENDAEKLNQLQQKLKPYFKEALAVRLIPAGKAAMDRDAEAPIRFAELDLIRRAENREQSFPEAALINDKWQLHWITPLPQEADQPAAGTLLITLDGTAFSTLLETGDSSLGESILLQKVAGSAPLKIASVGNAAVAEAHEISIPNTNWSVRLTPSEQLIDMSEELPAFWLFVISLTTVGSLVLAWVLSKVLVKAEVVSTVSTSAEIKKSAKTTDKEKKSDDALMVNPMYQNQDILDIAVIEEDDDILGLNNADGKKSRGGKASAAVTVNTPEEIFRSYDIRGIVGAQLTTDLAENIGKALGSDVLDQGEASIVVARDGRTHSDDLSKALIKGILSTGCHVINIGVVPTPVLYFATFHLAEANSGVMVTASHNPAEYNGFKMVINGVTLADDAVMDIRARILRQQFHRGHGKSEVRDITADYIDRIFSDVALAGNVSLVIDAGNAVTGVIAPRLFEELGCDVTPLYCDLDGTFPNHDPDPCKEENLRDLILKVKSTGADLGVAFDGDGDRLVVVTPKGTVIWPDHLLMLFAKDVLSRNPGADVLFDVKCSRQLNQVISSYGGRPIMWKTGHSQMKAKMIETGALIGGEYSGHIFIKDRWYGFDDGMYAMARLLEIITLRDQKIDDIFAAFPILPATPEIKISVPEAEKFSLVQKLIEKGDFQNGKPTTIDGLRVDFSKGWGLVRASNTSAALTLRFEGETQEALEKIQQLFKRELLKINPNLPINF